MSADCWAVDQACPTRGVVDEGSAIEYARKLTTGGDDVRTSPYGYTLVDGRLEPKAGEIEIVYRIVELRAMKTTLADIALHLTSSKVPTRRGGKWSAEQVRSILKLAKTHALSVTVAA